MKEQSKAKEEHSFRKTKALPWLVCSKCGLLSLNNPLTRWAISKGCEYSERPDYRQTVLKHTRLF